MHGLEMYNEFESETPKDQLEELAVQFNDIKLLKTKRRLLYLKTQSVPRCKHFSSRL